MAAADVAVLKPDGVVTLSANASISENGDDITYRVVIDIPPYADPVDVTLDVGVTVTIPVGKDFGEVVYTPSLVDDACVIAADVTATISALASTDYASLTADVDTAVTAVINDADETTFTLTASVATIPYNGGAITYTVTTSSDVCAGDVQTTLKRIFF